MEEVPPSPELVKCKKLRRKQGSSFSRLSFQSVNKLTERSTDQLPDDHEIIEPQQISEDVQSSSQPIKRDNLISKLSAFYFDDNSAQIETVDANPLTSAILLEKANAIPVQSRVPSPDFITFTNDEFLSVSELAMRNSALNQPDQLEHAKSIVPKQNYSFTQLELDSQMIDIFEAAELLACSAKQEEQQKAPVIDTIPQHLPPLNPDIIQTRSYSSNQIAPLRDQNFVETILHDFSEDNEFSWEIDFSVIRTESLRQRLRQLKDYIASPPQAVKKEIACRRYRNAVWHKKGSIARRLSYETDSSSRIGQPLTDDESETTSEREPEDNGGDISMDGVVLNESILIQANLTQLSAFFSQATHKNQNYREMGEKDEYEETNSIDREPSFRGFTPEPASPVSLASKEEYSPKALRLDFKTLDSSGDESLQSVEDHVFESASECFKIEQLLEDDEDLFMLAHPSEEYTKLSLNQKGPERCNNLSDKATSCRGLSELEELHAVECSSTNNSVNGCSVSQAPVNLCFNTARGSSIAVSEAALFKARTMFAEDVAQIFQENSNRMDLNRKASLEQNAMVMQHGRSKQNGNSANGISVPQIFSMGGNTSDGKCSGHGLLGEQNAKEKTMVSDETFNLERTKCAGNVSSVCTKSHETPKIMFVEEAKKSEALNVPSSTGGVGTTGGSTICATKRALARAETIFDEENFKMGKENVSGNVPMLGVGFSTAGGSKIAISRKALERAQMMFDEEETNTHGEGLWNASNDPPFAGNSSTAGRNSIAVAKQAPVDAKSSFADSEEKAKTEINEEQLLTDKENHENLPFQAFASTSGVSISILGHSSEKMKFLSNDFERENESPSSTNVPPMFGFSSAAGKRLQVSEMALTKAKLMYEQVELELDRENREVVMHDESQRKRKITSSQEEAATPTKRVRMNPLHLAARFHTSTPASAIVKKDATNSLLQKAPKQSVAGHEVDQFFAELDDEEFGDLFCNQQQTPKIGSKRQNKLLSKFEQCAEETKATEEATVNTSISHWDDSFTEILPKLPSDEQKQPISGPTKDVQRLRRMELQTQQQYVEAKPGVMRCSRISNFCRKKLRKDRIGLEEFVSGNRPTPTPIMTGGSSVTLNNAMEFKFNMIHYYGNTTGIPIGADGEGLLLMDEQSYAGMEEMKMCFLASPGIDPQLVPSGWVDNAWRWIVGKLSALERNLNEYCRGALTPENVFHQLQYRYYIEIDSARRPALRKILEKDDIASRRMVLFVSNVFPVDDSNAGHELELSDGWYCVRTVIDVPLAAAVREGKIAIGTKLMVQGGELLNHKDGCSPLEVPLNVRFKIHANSTRRARWSAKLGYYRCPVPFLTTCNSIHGRGGLICRLRALIVRVYPLVYVEKANADCHMSTLRSERMQQRHSRRNDANQLDVLHKLYNQIQQEIERERATAVLNKNVRVTDSTPCTQLQELLEDGLDVSFLDMELTLSQQAVVQRFQQQQHEELQNEINRRVKAQLDQRSSRSSVTPLLKVRMMDLAKPDKVFMLSIWRPTDDVRCVIQEHNYLELNNITANGTKNSDIQLTSHKSSSYRKLNIAPHPESAPPIATRFTRSIIAIGDIDPPAFRPAFNEFDTVGVVVLVGTSDSKKFQSIYLADTALELLCVNFWHGLAEYAYDDVVHERAILCVANLQWRTIGRQNQAIAQCFATEYTTFTENPRSGEQRAEWERFQLQLDAIDQEHFFQRCQEKISDLKAMTGLGVSTPTNVACSTPCQQRQMSSVQQQHSTPLGVGGGDSLTKRKMNTLATIYGSPPKLSPIVIRSNPTLRKGFKTPGRLEDAPSTEVDSSVS